MDANPTTRKKIYCEVCSTFVSSESLLTAHNNGKKHQRLLKARLERQASAERSIYVRGFCKRSTLESDLHDYFCKFGTVTHIFLDKEKAKYAIVQFENPGEAQSLLAARDLPLFYEKQLIIKKRLIKEPSTTKPKQPVAYARCKAMSDAVNVSYIVGQQIMDRIKMANTFDHQVTALVSSTCLTEDEIELRKLIVEYLQEIFVEVFPGCEIVLFGSSITGLGLKGADIDICLLADPKSFENKELMDENEDCSSPSDVVDKVTFIVKILRQFAAGIQTVVPVVSAKCPLVKFLHRDSGLSCDLSINNRLALRNTELIKSYVALDDRTRPLAVILKNWGAAKRLTGSGGRQISNYALVLLLVHFLQRAQPAVLPVLQHTIETRPCSKDTSVDEKTMIDGWNCSFSSTVRRNESPSRESVEDLLKGWFVYYGNRFDYSNEVITIHREHSKPVLKSDLSENAKQEPGRTNWFKASPLCVQDPFELSHNLTKNVPDDVLKQFTQCCTDAFSALSESASDISSVSSASSSSSRKGFLELFTVSSGSVTKPKKIVYSFMIKLLSSSVARDGKGVQTMNRFQRTCEFITNTLNSDLQVSCELQSSEFVPVKATTDRTKDPTHAPFCDNLCVKKTHQCGMSDDTCRTLCKRPREQEPTEGVRVKKLKCCKQGVSNAFLLHCKASNVTWQNRRRHRRLQRQGESANATEVCDHQQSDSGSEGNSVKKNKCETKEIPRQAMQMAVSTLSQDGDTPRNDDPLIEFVLKIESTKNCDECNVELSYLDGSFQDFLNFYAFFKKYIVTNIAKEL